MLMSLLSKIIRPKWDIFWWPNLQTKYMCRNRWFGWAGLDWYFAHSRYRVFGIWWLCRSGKSTNWTTSRWRCRLCCSIDAHETGEFVLPSNDQNLDKLFPKIKIFKIIGWSQFRYDSRKSHFLLVDFVCQLENFHCDSCWGIFSRFQDLEHF